MNPSAGSPALSSIDPQQWKEQMLAGGANRQQQIDELAKQFESILVRQFLDQALKPMDEENSLLGSNSIPMYDQIIKDTLSQSITQHSSLGFSNVLQATLYQRNIDNTENLKSDG